ncbi:hypothetical protein E1N52_43015 [Paraburkholderia guartelaensis]|uniref:SWIM-type domain-containing protein n=1 Tax=Paraburkholderia guartelaensis TaxID=2546446 RepID=A0A4R5L260_9BURK|nr:hypothetical protein E1N52_43015 [Paraburkholderia guartelaensis]
MAERRKQAQQLVARAIKAGKSLSPIAPYRGAIAKTFWGKAWCDNLEHYSDYASRLPRGRTYVRNGSVIDLQISTGRIRAQVMGSSLYEIEIDVTACLEKQWRALSAECASSVDSMVELLQGKLSAAVMGRICKPGSGLFPAPKDIRLGCNCLDGAAMCKHVAAVLYGVGARLDQQPELLFALRGVDLGDLVSSTGANLSGAGAGPVSGKVLDNVDLGDVFGIDIDTEPFADAPPARSKRTRKEAASQTARTPRSTALKSSTIAESTPKGKAARADVKARAAAVKKPKGETDPAVSKATRSAASPKPAVRAPAAPKRPKRRG